MIRDALVHAGAGERAVAQMLAQMSAEMFAQMPSGEGAGAEPHSAVAGRV
jgi:hypothetical protein